MGEVIFERVCSTDRHSTFYLDAGPRDGVPIIFVHGWPELAISWRHQIECFAGLGFRTIAPDIRGFGRSTVPERGEDVNVREAVKDQLELLSHLGYEKAIWVGHDVGAAIVWAIAGHHPETCIAVANLCVPYLPEGFTLDVCSRLVNREIYAADEFPNGQWSYWRQNAEHLEESAEAMDSDVEAFVRVCFRRGDPDEDALTKPAAAMKPETGWWPVIDSGKTLPVDSAIFDDREYAAYVAALKLTGFAPGLNYYRNNSLHGEYAKQAVNDGRLDMPVLFIHARYDPSCQTLTSALSDPMREACSNLSEATIDSGHWVQQEDPQSVNRSLVHWLANCVPQAWPET